MNREETLALYEQGVEAWNKWANEMLEEKKRLEEAGEWEVYEDIFDGMVPSNKSTEIWFNKAEANFSSQENPHIYESYFNASNFLFPSNANFTDATFKEGVSFDAAIFKGYTIFSGSIIEKAAWFSEITLESYTKFYGVRFYGGSWFARSIFREDILFESCKFKEVARFDFMVAEKDIFFNSTSFEGGTWFDHASFMNKAIFETSIFKTFISFKNAFFHNQTNFHAINSEGAFILQNTSFKKQIPIFIQANFKEAPRLDNIEFGDNVAPGNFINSITTFIHPDIKARYQALKRLAIQAHDHENEQRFWAGELRSDRSLRTEGGSWNLRPLYSAYWWGNIAYGCFSDYGSSIVKPLGTLLLLVILMTGLHLSISKEPLTYENTFSAGYISASKSIFNLGADPTKRSILKEKYSALYGVTEKQTPDIPKSILIAEMGQTLLSAIFIFLTLLGVRNNFKMK